MPVHANMTLSSMQHKKRYFEKCLIVLFPCNGHQCFLVTLTGILNLKVSFLWGSRQIVEVLHHFSLSITGRRVQTDDVIGRIIERCVKAVM